jgi:hypothetical protein
MVLQWKMEDVWSILQPFGIFCGYLLNFVVIWNILW